MAFEEVDLKAWSEFTKNRKIHLLQTAEWGELKSRFDWKVTRVIDGDFGVQILFKPLPFGYTVGYIPKISEEMFSRMNEPETLRQLDRVCKNHKAVFLKVEPDIWGDASHASYSPKGFRLSKHTIQPPNTILVDISGNEDDILGRMKQKFRYNIRLAAKKDVIVENSRDVNAFHKIMIETGGRDGFHVHSQDYYQQAFDLFNASGQVALLIAKYEDQPIAGIMVFAVGERSWYLYGASSNAERNRMPAYLAQWEAVKWARAKGCSEYDLWGVPDATEEQLEAHFSDRNDDLWGVYRFKRGFGGTLRRSVDTIDRVYSPLLYALYLARQKARGIPA